jgi:hypothetical protein
MTTLVAIPLDEAGPLSKILQQALIDNEAEIGPGALAAAIVFIAGCKMMGWSKETAAGIITTVWDELQVNEDHDSVTVPRTIEVVDKTVH